MKRSILPTLLMLIFCVFMQVSSITYFKEIHLIFLLWILSTLVFYGQEAEKILSTKKYKLLFFFMIYYFLVMTIATSIATGFARSVAMLELLSPIYMYDLYRVDKWNDKKYPLIVLFSILLVNMFLSFSMIEFMGDTGLRQTVQSDSDNRFKGAFDIVCSLTIIFPCFIYVLKNIKELHFRKIYNLIIILVLIVFEYFAFKLVFSAFFTTAIVTMIAGAFIALVYGRKRWLLKSLSVIVILLVSFLTFFNQIVSIVNNVSYGASRQITPKLYELNYALIGEQHLASDLTSRQNLSALSIRTFLEHPIYGVSYKVTDFEESILLGVGHHAEWYDDLALYGFFAILLFAFLWYASKQQIKDIKFPLPLLLLLFLGFNNPVLSFSMMTTVFLVVPVVIDILYSKTNYR